MSRRRLAEAATAAALLTACGGPDRGDAYRRDLAAAHEAERAGRSGAAADAYARASRDAKVPRDGAHARYLAAEARVRGGDVAGGAAELRVIADASPPGEDAPLAAYALAEIERARDEAEGFRALERLILRFPSSGIASRALQRIVRHDDETLGPAGALAHLRALEPRLASTELGERIAYAIALHLDAVGEKAAARDALLAQAKRWPYPGGTLWDDALYRASQLDEELGRPRDAIADLETMLAERESSHLLGSYQRPLYTPALVRVGVLYRDALHDRARAREAFHRLYADFTTSVNRDDALWEEAALFRDDADTADACARLRTLVDEFPDSRYVPCAVDLCNGVTRPAASRAPATCHAYIMRARYGQARTSSE